MSQLIKMFGAGADMVDLIQYLNNNLNPSQLARLAAGASGNSPRFTMPDGSITTAPKIVGVQAVPVGIPPSGSITSNGTDSIITLGTALSEIYGPTGVSPGIYLYLPAGALYAGSPAGCYWSVFTSTTVGTVYLNTAVFPGVQSVPAMLLHNTTVMGATGYSAVTAPCTLGSMAVKANSMGLYGGWRETIYLASSGGSPVYQPYFGSTKITENTTGAATGYAWQTTCFNRGSTSQQTVNDAMAAFGAGVTQKSIGLDTTQDQNVSLLMYTAGVVNWVVLKSMLVESFFG